MPNLSTILKDEISRLARKEIRSQMGATKKAVGHYRSEIAELKRQTLKQARKIAFLETQEKKRLSRGETTQSDQTGRFSPKWLKSHRERLGVSAEDYGNMVGVSGKTVYNWEQGKSKPLKKQLAGLVSVRGLGKREVLRRIEIVKGAKFSPQKKRRTK